MEKFIHKEIIDQVNRILSSSQICNSNVLAEFLKYIIKETLEGRSGELKEYTIGVAALRREIDFNPQLDSIVRIHAGRLRRALNTYYHEEGKNDPVVISIPKGSYVPAFAMRSQEVPVGSAYENDRYEEDGIKLILNERSNGHDKGATNSTADKEISLTYNPVIAVLPFRYLGTADKLDHFTVGLSEYLSTELTRFDGLRVVSFYSVNNSHDKLNDIRELGSHLGAEYLVTGSVQLTGDGIRVYVQLSSCSRGIQLWAHTFEKNAGHKDNWAFQEEVVNRLIAYLTGINGIVTRQEFLRLSTEKHSTKSQPLLSYWYYQYQNHFDAVTILAARKFYEGVIKREPENAMAIAYLSEIMAGETLLPAYKPEKVNRGISFAHLAIKVDPQCQQGYQSLAINLLMLHNREECVRVLKEGLSINPKSVDYRGAMGALMIFAGEFEQGIQTLDSVTNLHPGLPWWQIIGYSFYSYYKKFYSDALFWVDRVEQDVIWKPIIKAAAYAQLDQVSEARSILRQMKKDYPSIDLLKQDTLSQFFHSDALVNELKRGIMKVSLN